MSTNSIIEKSEQRLIMIHNSLAAKVKSFKRLFIKRGLMMRTFDYINYLHQKGYYSEIRRMMSDLYKDLPHLWQPRYGKYIDLIKYCQFLESYHRRKSDTEGIILAKELIGSLDMGHELGNAIQKQVNRILNS